MTSHERIWYRTVGARLRIEREKRGWALYDVAAVLGVSGNAVSLWERGLRRMKAYHYDQLRREGLLP